MNNSRDMYLNSLERYTRIPTKEVLIGDVGIGGDNPIRIQSMTTVDTMNTQDSVNQAISMIEAGCELVRLTAPSIKEAKNLYSIKNELMKRGYKTPLIADIHFTPNAAIEAAKIVEKVRINPGNFSDKKKFQNHTYSKEQYKDELKRIEEKFMPLIDVCKDHQTAMRIGTNHGSLSDRIMSQYGDTPLGMVESALEFVRICQKVNYHKIILSMKASNTIVMTQAYRLLVAKMREENMMYPIHLGVTEAGEGDDGRVKSAIGIGSLLLDGIGDTIRVSLTESPEKEIPVAKAIIKYIETKKDHPDIIKCNNNPLNLSVYSKRITKPVLNIGGKNLPIVIEDLSSNQIITTHDLLPLGYRYSKELDKWHINDRACDYIFVGKNDIDFAIPGTLRIVYNYNKWKTTQKGYPLMSLQQYLSPIKKSKKLNIIELSLPEIDIRVLKKLMLDFTAVLLIRSHNINNVLEQRRLFIELINKNIFSPVIIARSYNHHNNLQLQIDASVDIGSLFLDGLGDGVFLTNKSTSKKTTMNLVFDILQGTRTRISKTEYISCPSCGRTLFDLEKTTEKIRQKTSHLKGLKIGVMGCIVNGPGEMADADYGYVGTGPGKVSLYKKQKMVQKNIDSSDALDRLIQLIKKHGDWIDAQ